MCCWIKRKFIIFNSAAMMEFKMSSTSDKNIDKSISKDDVKQAAERVVKKFVNLSVPDLNATDKIRWVLRTVWSPTRMNKAMLFIIYITKRIASANGHFSATKLKWSLPEVYATSTAFCHYQNWWWQRLSMHIVLKAELFFMSRLLTQFNVSVKA